MPPRGGVSSKELVAAITFHIPGRGMTTLTNVQIAQLTHCAIYKSPYSDYAVAPGRWLSGQARMPREKYELLMLKIRLIMKGLATLEELCSGVMLHELPLEIKRKHG